MNKRMLLLACALFISGYVCAQNPQKYRLSWYFKEGLHNVNNQTITIETARHLLDKDLSTRVKTVDEFKANVVSSMHWEIENAIGDSQYIIAIKYRNGKVKCKHQGKTYDLNMETPKDIETARAELPPMRILTQDGVAFFLDTKKKEVLATWVLWNLGEGKYKKLLWEGATDPLGLAFAYKQLPDEAIPVGHEWELKRETEYLTYNYCFKFEKIEQFKGKSVARVTFSAKIMSKEEEVGTTSGYFLHDYQRGLMVYMKIKESKEMKVVMVKDNEVLAFIEEFKISQETELKKTNAAK